MNGLLRIWLVMLLACGGVRGAVITMEEAMDTPGRNWSGSNWVGQAAVSFDGEDALVSTDPTSSQAVSLSTFVQGPGTVRWKWKLDANASHESVFVTLDHLVKDVRITGTTDWTTGEIQITDAGTHLISWEHERHGEPIDGGGAAYLDAFELIVVAAESPPVIERQPEDAVGIAGVNMLLSVDVDGSPPFEYRWFRDGRWMYHVSESRVVDTVPANGAEYFVVVSNEVGMVTSRVARIDAELPGITLAEALDTTNVIWRAKQWFPQTRHTSDGVDAVIAASETDYSSSGFSDNWLEAVIEGPGTLSWDWKVENYASKRPAFVTIDGYFVFIGAQLESPTNVWTTVTKKFDRVGPTVVRWIRADGVGELEKVVIDRVRFDPIPVAPPQIVKQPRGGTNLVGSRVRLSPQIVGHEPMHFQWFKDGIAIPNATKREFNSWEDSHEGVASFHVRASNAAGTVTSLPATISFVPATTLGDAVDAPELTWTTDGSQQWFAQDAIHSRGGSAARVNGGDSGEVSWIQTVVTGPGILSWKWKLSASPEEFLEFWIDDIPQARFDTKYVISGEQDWQEQSVELLSAEALPARVSWVMRNGSPINGTITNLNAAWLDDVRFLSTNNPPRILVQPVDWVGLPGEEAGFSVLAVGEPPLRYQWQFNGVDIPGASSQAMTVSPRVEAFHVGDYRVIISNDGGSVASAVARVDLETVVPLADALDNAGLVWRTGGDGGWRGITGGKFVDGDAAQPSLRPGESWLETEVVGPGTLRWDWREFRYNQPSVELNPRIGFYGGQVIHYESGQSAELKIDRVGTNRVRWIYRRQVVEGFHDIPVVDNVRFVPMSSEAPTIKVQPESFTTFEYGKGRLEVQALGTQPLQFQWRREGIPVPDATNAFLSFEELTPTLAGTYTVVISNLGGMVASAAAIVTLTNTPDLGVALGATNLVWRTGGDIPWTPQVQLGRLLAFTPGAADARQGAARNSWIETEVIGPGRLYWIDSGDNPRTEHPPTVRVNGQPVRPILVESQWEYAGRTSHLLERQSVEIPDHGLNTVRWERRHFSKSFSAVMEKVIYEALPPEAPRILRHPKALVEVSGRNANLDVFASGTGPLSYEWLKNGNALPGQTNATLAFTELMFSDAGEYSVTVSNDEGSVTSQAVTLEVIAPIPLGEALDQPTWVWTSDDTWYGQTNITHDGTDAAMIAVTDDAVHSLETTVIGPGKFSWHWRREFPLIQFFVDGERSQIEPMAEGWDEASLTLEENRNYSLRWEVSDPDRSGRARAWIDNVRFAPALIEPLEITSSPGNSQEPLGGSVEFRVEAAGTRPFAYQWFKDGAALPSATNQNLVIDSVQANDAGAYHVQVGNGARTVTSSPADLTLQTVPAGLAEALDNDLTWTVSPVLAWFGQREVSFDGEESAMTLGIVSNGVRRIETTVNGPGRLTWHWMRNDGRTRVDFFADSSLSLSATNVWVRQEHVLNAFGPQTIAWEFSASAGHSVPNTSRAWLDQVQFDPLSGELPVVNQLPQSLIRFPGEAVNLNGSATGSEPMTARWLRDGKVVAYGWDLELRDAGPDDQGDYFLVVSNPVGSATSAPVQISVVVANVALGEALDAPDHTWRTGGPIRWFGQTQETLDGEDAAMVIGYAGPADPGWLELEVDGPVEISWRQRGTPDFIVNGLEANPSLSGSSWSNLRAGSHVIDQVGRHRVRWSLTAGNFSSSGFGNPPRVVLDCMDIRTLPVNAVVMLRQPVGVTNASHNAISLSVVVEGSGPLALQWHRDGVPLVGATNDVLKLDLPTPADSGSYTVGVTNSLGGVLSDSATVKIFEPIPLAEALDSADLYFQTTGIMWFGQTFESHDGQDAAFTAPPVHGIGRISTGVLGPGLLSWKWKRGPGDDDDLTFSHDSFGSLTAPAGDWTREVYRIDHEGRSLVTWSLSAGNDGLPSAFLDEVTFTPLRSVQLDGGLVRVQDAPRLRLSVPDATERSVLQSATDLRLKNWTSIYTNQSGQMFEFLDLELETNGSRFFRILPLSPP